MSAKKAAADGGEKRSAWLYFGGDDLSARRAAEKKVAELCPEGERDFGLEAIVPGGEEKTSDAACDIIGRAISALLTPPLFGGAKTVFLDGVPAAFFDSAKDPGRFASVKAAVEQLLDVVQNRMPPQANLVVLTGKLNKIQTFYKRMEKYGHAESFDEPEGRGADKAFLPKIQEKLEELGLKMGMTAQQILAERTGYNLRQAENELEKLSLYVGDRGTATVEDVQEMVASVKTGKYWEFGDTYCGGDLAKTLGVYRSMLKQGENPVGLLSMLEGNLREMTLLADCVARGWLTVGGGRFSTAQWNLPPEGERVLEGMKLPAGWSLARKAEMAGRHNAEWWFRRFEAAIRTHETIISGNRLDPEIAVELFLVKTLRSPARSRA